ncbi:hypothetical protein Bca101_056134 [Brassica carinata]
MPVRQAVGRPFLYKNTAMGSKSHTIFPKRSAVWLGDRWKMTTRGKEKDMEKGLSTPERTPKLEQELEPVDGAGRLSGRGLEDQGESSNAGHHDGQRVGTAGQVNQAAEPTTKEVLEAMQAMGTQILALTQSLTPIRAAIPIGNERIARW